MAWCVQKGNSADAQEVHWLSWKTSQRRKEETQLNGHGDTRLFPGSHESLAQEPKNFGQSWFTFGWTQPTGENPIACGSVWDLWWVSHKILFCVAFVFLENNNNNNWQCFWCNISKKVLFKTVIWDLPDGPVIKNPPSNAGNACLVPGWETKIPHAWSN